MDKRRYMLLSVADAGISLCIVFPLVIMHWRGIWDLIGFYILPKHTPLNYYVITCLGLLQMVGVLTLPMVTKKLKSAGRIQFWILSRLFLILHSLTQMFFWYGLWSLQDQLLPKTVGFNLPMLCISYLCLALLGGCTSNCGSPFSVSLDTPDPLAYESRFRIKPTRGQMMDYVSDAFVSQIIVLGIVIICWRSAWVLMDISIFPGEKLRSDVTSAVAGLIGCSLLLCLQRPLGLVSIGLARRSVYLKLAWEDAVYFITFIALSLLWRGAWNLNYEYMIKELPLGGWVNHIAGTIGLLAMHTYQEASILGMVRDGTAPGGEAFYPIHYLRHFMEGWYTRDDTPDIQAGHRDKIYVFF